MVTEFPKNGIQQLIQDRRGDRSMESLSKACGGVPARANLQRLASRPILNWPKDSAVITGLAKGLGVRVADVVNAFGCSLGLPTDSDSDDLVLKGAGKLPAESKKILMQTAENLLWWQEQTELAESSQNT